MDHFKSKISIYKNFNLGLSNINSRPNYIKSHSLNMEQIYEVIKEGGGIHEIEEIKGDIVYIRSHAKEEYQFKKLGLPSFTVSAEFKGKRNKQSEKEYTQIMGFDFDKLDTATLSVAVEMLKEWEGTALMFRSPSGKGLKVFVLVDSKEEDHELVYKCIAQSFKHLFDLNADMQCVDYTRLCYFSCDQDAFFNENAALVPSKEVVNKYKHLLTVARELELDINFEQVNTDSIKSIFYSFLEQLKSNGVDWKGGKRNQFLLEVCKVKRFGIEFNECLTELLTFIDGRYTSEYRNDTIPVILRRNWGNYFAIEKPKESKKQNIDNYLTEKIDYIKFQLREKRILFIDAPTGTGKTTMVKALAKELNLKTDILMPTTALVEQQEVLGLTGRRKLSNEHRNSNILACCYNSVNKIQARESKLLVIDEAHSLVSDYGYKQKTIQDIQRCLDNYEYTIYLSGSILTLEGYYSQQNLLSFENKNRFDYEYELVSLDRSVSNKDYFINTLQAGKLNVFYKNDKAELDKLYEYLTGKGYKVAYISSDKKEEVAYLGIVKGSSLIGYDVLLTTCVIQAGVNISECDREVVITYGSNSSLIDYVQFTARFRNHAPYVKIIHTGKLGQMYMPNDRELKARMALEKKLLEKAREKNYTRDLDLFSLETNKIVSGLDLVFMDNYGNYIEDIFCLLHNRYTTLNRNIASNTRVLGWYLAQFNFTQRESTIISINKEESKELKKIGRNYTKERKDKIERVANAILDGAHAFHQATDKVVQDIERKYNFLSKHMANKDIRAANLLTSKSAYKLYESRILYAVAAAKVKDSRQVSDFALTDYVRFKALERKIQINKTYTSSELKEILLSIGFTATKTRDYIRSTLSVLYTYVVSQDKVRYTITGKVKLAGLLKPSDTSNINSDTNTLF